MSHMTKLIAALFAAAPLALLGCDTEEGEVDTGINEYEVDEPTQDEDLIEEDEGVFENDNEGWMNNDGALENENEGALENENEGMLENEDEGTLENERQEGIMD